MLITANTYSKWYTFMIYILYIYELKTHLNISLSLLYYENEEKSWINIIFLNIRYFKTLHSNKTTFIFSPPVFYTTETHPLNPDLRIALQNWHTR